MHQQVRCSIRKASGVTAGELAEEESLIEILTLLRTTNLRSAGRVHGDGGGEFVFSVRHRPGDNSADVKARDDLRDADYQVEVYEVKSFDLDDKEGALLAFIQKVEADTGESVIEVHIGSAEPNRKVPVQLVTPSMLNRRDS